MTMLIIIYYLNTFGNYIAPNLSPKEQFAIPIKILRHKSWNKNEVILFDHQHYLMS
jgi:hypothetical protein